ncbi:DNA dependent ATPase [Coprinopsis sp. MPI-PUGE-AT-0042]|nr:DNA dependent ATPase [Coprinopsis sp. MPI-PUGE-AT-0042]
MSRRASNNVRGPTSALTAFLRVCAPIWQHRIDAGITHATIARRRATQQQPDNAQPQAGPSTAPQDNDDQAEASPSPQRPSRRTSRRASGYGSDNLDDDDEGDANEEEGEGARMDERRAGDDSDFDDDEDDPYTSLSKSMWTNSKPPVGNFENCARCKKQFTVTKYTMAANPPPGWLCHICAKSSGQDPFKKPAAPRKRKAPADKREITHFVENRLPSLVNLCIKLVAKHIDDVESLGDIGSLNMDAIAKAMSKSRLLTADNAKLFYNATNSRLTFFDATNLAPPALETLALLNPNLTHLRLDFCGQLDDKAFKAFATSLPSLKRVELLGPFLVRVAGWKAFLKAHPDLEGFLVTQSPRFDLECTQELVKHCKNLKELRMKEFALMSDAMLEEIATMGEGLTYLDISCPGKESCSEPAVVDLLAEIGGTLQGLDVAKHDLLSAHFLYEGLIPHCHNLETLSLSHLVELKDEDVAKFFTEWENPALVQLEMARIHELKDNALEAIMKHSGNSLEVLNINGWKEVSEPALRTIGRLGKEIKKLDVGFCREVDDFLVKAWLEGEEVNGVVRGGCKNLQELKVWGCNKLTDKCPRRSGLAIHGVETHIIRMN